MRENNKYRKGLIVDEEEIIIVEKRERLLEIAEIAARVGVDHLEAIRFCCSESESSDFAPASQRQLITNKPRPRVDTLSLSLYSFCSLLQFRNGF